MVCRTRSCARGNIPSGPPAGPARPVGPHRHGRARHPHRRRAAGAPSLSLRFGVLRLECRGGARRRELYALACGMRRRCGRSVTPRPSIAPTVFQRRSVTSSRMPPKTRPAVRSAVRALWHAADPQQPRRSARERRDREPARSPQARRCSTLLLRGGTDFDSLELYRDWIADLIGRRNARREKSGRAGARHAGRIAARRTSDYDEVAVRVTSSSGFILRKVFSPCRSPDRLSAEPADLR